MKKITALTVIILLMCSFFVFKSSSVKNQKNIISFSSWGSRTETEILKEIINDYEKNNTDIKIQFIHIPENYFRKLHLLYAAKTAPDVVFINNTYAPLYIKADLLEDLTPYCDKNEYFESSVKSFEENGKLYAIPRDVSGLVLYINKNIVKNPEEIKTLDDLRFYAKKYTNKNHFGLNYEKNPLFWLYYLNYFNGGILSDDGKKVILNSENSIKGINFYTDMINQDKSVPQEWQLSSVTSAQMFINQKTAMYLSGRWLVPKFREVLKFDWDIIPFPQTENSKILIDASGYAVSKSSRNKEEAIKFVKYLSSAQISEKITSTGLITPARKDVAQSGIFLDKKQKPYNSQVFIDSIITSKPTPVNANYAKITDAVTNAMVPVFNGKQNTDSVLNDDFIKKLQKYCDKE